MRLLITTQIVDASDPHLGFFVAWVREFAKHCEQVTVICLRKGAYDLPPNVRVFPLGGNGKLTRSYKLLKGAWRFRDNYDAVFVHMNPEYLVVAGLLWRVLKKKTALWYAHKSVTVKLRIAVWLTTSVMSVTMDSFRIRTPKLQAMGHGIDTELFSPGKKSASDMLRIVTVGRIAKSKHVIDMLPVVSILKKRGANPVLSIIGDAGNPQEEAYKEELIFQIQTQGLERSVRLIGAVSHRDLPPYLRMQDVALNFGATGNMDKGGFEPLAMGLPLVTTNEAFEPLLVPYGLYVRGGNPENVAEAILKARDINMELLVRQVKENHSLARLVPKILAVLS
jgi:glycosyltransferase involved in cell wall biosynthesis